MSAFPPIDRHPSSAKLRELAATFALVTGLLVLHAVYVREDGGRAVAIAVLGGALSIAPLVPVVGRLVYLAWMGFGVAMGRMVGPIVLTLLYLLVVVPLALFGRVLGRDRLRLKRNAPGTSYWERVPRPTRKSDYFRPF